MHELALMTLLLWGVGYAACRLADRLRISRLALGVAAGLLLGPAVLGQALPRVHHQVFEGSGEIRDKIAELQARRVEQRKLLVATGVTDVAVEMFDSETRELAIPLDRQLQLKRSQTGEFVSTLMLIAGLLTLTGVIREGGPAGFHLEEAGRVSLLRLLPSALVMAGVAWIIMFPLWELVSPPDGSREPEMLSRKLPGWIWSNPWPMAVQIAFACAMANLAAGSGLLGKHGHLAGRLLLIILTLGALATLIPLEHGTGQQAELVEVEAFVKSPGAVEYRTMIFPTASWVDRWSQQDLAQVLAGHRTFEYPNSLFWLLGTMTLLAVERYRRMKWSKEHQASTVIDFPQTALLLSATGCFLISGMPLVVLVALACLFLNGLAAARTVAKVVLAAGAPLLFVLVGFQMGGWVFKNGFLIHLGFAFGAILIARLVGAAMIGLGRGREFSSLLGDAFRNPGDYSLAFSVVILTGLPPVNLDSLHLPGISAALFLMALIGWLIDQVAAPHRAEPREEA